MLDSTIKNILQQGTVIPAMPLALDANRKFAPRNQRALLRYYSAAGAGGVAAGVHTTQFEIREPQHALFQPVLEFAAQTFDELDRARDQPLVRIAGICGKTEQALSEAKFLNSTGYHAGLLSLAALQVESEEQIVEHCQKIADVIPIVGFYLGAHVGGRVLPYSFWRKFAEIENVVAIKIAAFNRYQTIDCLRAVVDSGREDIALYTGNDDNIVLDLVTPFRFQVEGQPVERRFVGGLLGHWSVWTKKAVELLQVCHRAVDSGNGASEEILRLAIEVTDSNAAFFDPANRFAGCIAGLHEVLRRQGIFSGVECLNPEETLSAGQAEEIDRVYQAYPHLHDDAFVAEQLNAWLAD